MSRLFAFSIMALLLVSVGIFQSWIVALTIIQLCIISSIMALGVNIQWGYAGIFNVGVVGFAALGGLAAVIIGHPPIAQTIEAGGQGILDSVFRLFVVGVIFYIISRAKSSKFKTLLFVLASIGGYVYIRLSFAPAIGLIENTDAAKTGFLGGLGFNIYLSWIVAAILAGLVAWLIGKITLGLRADYLAIATLGIAEILVAIIKNENWLTRGVKNVTNLPRAPVPFELDLQNSIRFQEFCAQWGWEVSSASSIVVKLCFIFIFLLVLLLLLWLSERALNSPWGRMMRAIRDNEQAAKAMGKDVKRRHLQIFILGSAVIGIAGAMLVTLNSQLVPTAYNPLRFTFLIWVMVIVGGSGNNWGSILGGFLIWFLWVQTERAGPEIMHWITFMFPEGGVKAHLIGNAEQMRVVIMGLILILTLRFAPKGLLPEVRR